MMEFHTLNAALQFAGSYRTETLHGREFWVAPFVSLVEGVLNGSKGPLFYPAEEIRKNPGAWNGMPLTYGHPTTRNGNPLPGRSPEVADKFQLGYVYNDWTEGDRRGGEAWFDKQWTRQKAPAVANKLAANQPIELSTGLGTEDYAQQGKDKRGRSYSAVARNYAPDHLAILTDQRGACSLADGCGIGRNAEGESVCPKCGGKMKDGKCVDCGYSVTDNLVEGTGTGAAGSPLGVGIAPTDEKTVNFLGRVIASVVNAFKGGLPRSQTTGRVKQMGAGTGAGPVHEAGQRGFNDFTPTDDHIAIASDLPSYAIDETVWEKAKSLAQQNGREADWPYVVGVYQKLGGGVEARNAEAGHPFYGNQYGSGGSSSAAHSATGAAEDAHEKVDEYKREKDVPKSELEHASSLHSVAASAHETAAKDTSLSQEARDKHSKMAKDHKDTADLLAQSAKTRNAMRTRAENVQFLVANCDCWKTKAGVLNDVKLFSDAEVANLATNFEEGRANRLVVNAVKKVAGDRCPKDLVAIPHFVHNDMKMDDEDVDSSTEEPPVPPSKKKKKGDEPTENSTFSDVQLDAISKQLFGRPAAEVRNSLDEGARREQQERTVVINQLLAPITEAKRDARRKQFEKLTTNELRDRLELLKESGALVLEARNDDRRGSVYGGKLDDSEERVDNAAGDEETFDAVTNCSKSAA